MMTPEQIAAMRADADAGTPGPWAYRPLELDDWGIIRGSDDLVVAQASACREAGNLNSFRESGADPTEANARNIARVPDMIATILSQAAEIERLKAAGANDDGLLSALQDLADGASMSLVQEIAQQAYWHLAYLRSEVTRLKSCIPWREGPPPEEWRDGRQVLVWAKHAHHVCWGAGSWHIVNGSGAQIVQSMITHHAAIDKPGETG